MLEDDAWPLVLLVARIATVGLLYLFLATAFRALRADLRASSAPAPARRRRQRRVEPVPASVPVAGRDDAPPTWPAEDEAAWETDEDWGPEALPEPVYAPRVSEQTRGRARVWVPVMAAVLAVGLGTGAFIYAGGLPGEAPSVRVQENPEATPDPFQPPTVPPGPGEVTVGLAATEDANVRVTVDGVVQFDGVLPRGEQQLWDEAEHIQVWTDSGKTLQLAVNGVDLGAYSPAMGHPDWNRIDYAFWPGWGQ